MNKIYLDNHSTTPVDPEILNYMLPYFSTKIGNPSSRTHSYGWEAEAAVEKSREEIAKLINSKTNEIIFTSGATESNNIALSNTLSSRDKNHIITCSTEHRAILDICKELKKKNIKTKYLKPYKNGLIDIAKLNSEINDDTYMVTIMHANNEIGVIQPIKEIGLICRKNNVLFHVDGAQSLGRIPVDVMKMNVDLMSFSSHKMYGPKGVGALYVNNKIKDKLSAITFGGGQEQGLRPGTLPVPLIVGFGKACKKSINIISDEAKTIEELRNMMLDRLKNEFPNIIINGSMKKRLPGNLNISFPDLRGQSIVTSIPQLALSSGSACSSSSPKASHVLLELGLSKDLCNSSIRIGIGRFNTAEDIDFATKEIIKTVRKKIK